MHRIALVCFVISGLSACVVGDPTPGRTGTPGGSPDASGDPGPGPDAAPAADCEPVATVIPDGHHNPGQACLTCHGGGDPAAPLFTLAGTIYDSGAGTTALPGATIIVEDGAGTQLKLISAGNGNFYTGQAVTFPVHITASRCPDSVPMLNAQQVGDCNSCHANQSHIHLP